MLCGVLELTTEYLVSEDTDDAGLGVRCASSDNSTSINNQADSRIGKPVIMVQENTVVYIFETNDVFYALGKYLMKQYSKRRECVCL